MMSHDAVRRAYPNVVTINGDGDNLQAFDADGERIVPLASLVAAAAIDLMAEEKNRPIVVSRLRFKLELADRGLLTDVGQAVQAAGAVPQIYWAEATEFESDHPLVLQIGAELGLSRADIRTMFNSAVARDV
jgi:hypothetical protein